MPVVLAVVVIVLICWLIAWLIQLIENSIILASPVFVFIGNNFFLIAGILFWLMAILVIIYFKPHPAEKHLKRYRKGEITKRQAIGRVVDTMYNYKRDGVPPAYESKLIEKRLNALRKRVKIETAFMNDLVDYMKARTRVE